MYRLVLIQLQRPIQTLLCANREQAFRVSKRYISLHRPIYEYGQTFVFHQRKANQVNENAKKWLLQHHFPLLHVYGTVVILQEFE